MTFPHPCRIHPNIIAALAVLTVSAGGDLLYRTDFENFTSGDNRWAGTDGWQSNDTANGVQGIDQDIIEGGGLGKTAFLGFNQPASTTVLVAKQFNHAPQPGDLPLVRVETLIGIQDSTAKTARDSFFVSVYNSSGGYLAGIRFDNRQATYGIWRADGANADQDTGVIFYRGELHLLSFTVNLLTNRWSAELVGPPPDPQDPRPVVTTPLFENAPFTATGRTVNFGALAYEWKLGATSAAGYGDNWMLVADTEVRSVPLGIEPFKISSITRVNDTTTLSWPAQKGFDYQVEYSTNLVQWLHDLPGSSFPSVAADQTLSFQDSSAETARHYRILRTETP